MDKITEAAVRALAQVRERNGGPPYDAYDIVYGEPQARKMRESLVEEAREVIEAIDRARS